MIHRRERKSKFQQRLEEVAKIHREETDEVSQDRSSQTAQPPNLFGKYKWKDMMEEQPPYYAPIHIYDGKTIHHNWSRVWSETLGNIYVNNEDDRVITKVTHWSAPNGLDYPKYEPLTEDDVKRYTKRDVKVIIHELKKLIDRRENSKLPSVDYVAGVDDAIIILEKMTRPKRMTGT